MKLIIGNSFSFETDLIYASAGGQQADHLCVGENSGQQADRLCTKKECKNIRLFTTFMYE